ncbi:MAG TPA: hypothetical protein VGT61_03965 [Thermomicrobiales bacterium]|jgi:8-oxo-dGTP diphosphatase|nr:hypothetical protein [Thermomicrobiales bacterium]
MTAPDAPPAPATGPEIDLRVVALTRDGDRLLVVMADREPDSGTAFARGLPRGRPDFGTELDRTASAIARRTTGIAEQYLEQLYTISVDQSSRGSWKLVVAWMALISPRPDGVPALPPGADWVPVTDLPTISRIDRQVIDYALVRLRAKLGYTSIGRYLLTESFTMRELQDVYETILGQPLDKRNFRRRMLATGILTQTDGQRRDGSHRPAALYRFDSEEDQGRYLTPTWSNSQS